MKQIDELTMNSIGFAILCNFPQFCGMERAKEASEQFRAIKEELLIYRTIGTPEELKTLLQEKTQREQGCEYCKGKLDDWEAAPHEFRIDENVLYYSDSQFGWEGTAANYCFNCGRKLDGGGGCE